MDGVTTLPVVLGDSITGKGAVYTFRHTFKPASVDTTCSGANTGVVSVAAAPGSGFGSHIRLPRSELGPPKPHDPPHSWRAS